MNGVAEFFNRAHIFYDIEHALKFIITICTLLLYTRCIYAPRCLSPSLIEYIYLQHYVLTMVLATGF